MLLSCDIAFSHLGWTVINGGKPEACGVIETEKTKRKNILVSNDYFNRSSKIATELEEVVNTYGVKGLLGELPSGGAKSSRAAIQMNMATGIIATFCKLKGLPAEFCTPNDVKRATVGRLDASKSEIMDFIIKRFPGKKTTKYHKCRVSKNFPKGRKPVYTYHFCGQEFGVGNFEHIADSMGVYMHLKDNGNLVTIYGGTA